MTTSKDELDPATSVLGASASRPSVLLIEDDRGTHSALRKILGKLGWEVHSAMTVSSGLSLLDLKPDAVVLDLMLPDGDGEEILRKIRADQLETKVAITTGIEDRVRLEEVHSLRPDALLRKPLELNDLLRAIGVDQSA